MHTIIAFGALLLLGGGSVLAEWAHKKWYSGRGGRHRATPTISAALIPVLPSNGKRAWDGKTQRAFDFAGALASTVPNRHSVAYLGQR